MALAKSPDQTEGTQAGMVSSDATHAALAQHSEPAARAIWQFGTALLALLALVIVLILTIEGPGVEGDSVHYVMGAENLASGEGFSRFSGGGEIKPITHFPPFLSIMLAPFALLETNLFEVARILNAVLFATTIVLAAYLARAATRSTAAGIIAGLLLAVSEPLLTAHSYVMTEGLYIVLSLAALGLLAMYLEERDRKLSLIVSALFVSASLLTRYAGLSLAFACVAGVLLVGPGGWRIRILDTALFGSLAVLPLGLWFVRNRLVAETVANRTVGFHSMSTELVNTYLGELVALIFARQVPLSWRPRALLAGIIAWTGPVYFVLRSAYSRLKGDRNAMGVQPLRPLRWLLLMYTLAYFAAFVANTLFFDAGTTLAVVDRYVTPGYVVLVILSVITSHDLICRARPRQVAAGTGLAVAGFLVVIHVLQSTSLFGQPGIDLGYMRVRNENPEAVDTLRELDPDAEVVTNNPELFYVLAGRPAYRSPIRQDPSTLEIRDDYPEQVALVERVLDQGGALVLLFPIREDDQLVLDHIDAQLTRPLMVGSIYKDGDNEAN